jgi:hypothetical protein
VAFKGIQRIRAPGHALQTCALGAYANVRENSGGKWNAGTGSGQDGFRIGTVAGTHLALTSSRPGHTRVSSQSPERKRRQRLTEQPSSTPLSSELRHCTAYPELRPEATWAQPLCPGRAVLTRGVSRRSGSVACIRADASPTEVLAHPSWHRKRCRSNIIGKRFAVSRSSVQIRTLTARDPHVSPAVGNTQLAVGAA